MKLNFNFSIILIVFALLGCESSAYTASYNLSQAADEFQVNRRVTLYNGITGDILLVIEGKCSIEADTTDNQLEIICKTGADEYWKHFFGLSDNTPYLLQQLEPSKVSQYHHTVQIKPQTAIPNLEIKGDLKDLGNTIKQGDF